MKKYISAILLNALLIQLAGCYTQREITYDEFYNMPKEQEAKIIFYDEKSIELVSDSLMKNYINWEKEQDTLILYLTHLKKVESKTLKEVTDTSRYPKADINKIFVEEYDGTKTVVVIITFVLLAVSFYAITQMKPFTWLNP